MRFDLRVYTKNSAALDSSIPARPLVPSKIVFPFRPVKETLISAVMLSSISGASFRFSALSGFLPAYMLR
jgi:hypothetical protein